MASTIPGLHDNRPRILKIEIQDDDVPTLLIIPPQDLANYIASDDTLNVDYYRERQIHLTIKESPNGQSKCHYFNMTINH